MVWIFGGDIGTGGGARSGAGISCAASRCANEWLAGALFLFAVCGRCWPGGGCLVDWIACELKKPEATRFW